MGFWENNKDSITSGLKSAGKYGYQGTKYVAKTGYKASKKHYNNSKSRREKKNGKKNSSDEDYESEEEEYERKPTDIRNLKDPNSFPPPPLKPGQRTYTGQQQQQIPNGQSNYASQGAYQGQTYAETMDQSQYPQQQYSQYSQQQYSQYPQQQQAAMPEQTPVSGEQISSYRPNSSADSFQSLPQLNQPQNAISSQVSLNSGFQQSAGFPQQISQYCAQSCNLAAPLSSQNNFPYQQQQQQPSQYGSQGPSNPGQPQLSLDTQRIQGPQQQSSVQFDQRALPPLIQSQQQQQPFPSLRGQPISEIPGQFLSNGLDQQQQQQRINQDCAPLSYGNQFNAAGISGSATIPSVAHGQPIPNATNMQDATINYGTSPIQVQPLTGGQPPVPVRMQPQPPQPLQPIQSVNSCQAESTFDSTSSTPHFQVTPFDPDAPIPKPKIDMPMVDVKSLPPPPTHRDRGAVVKQDSASSARSLPVSGKKIVPNAGSSSTVSLPPRNPNPTTTDNELKSGKEENDESTAKSSILGHYDVELNIVPPPKPFRHGLGSVSTEYTGQTAPEQKAPTLPSRNSIGPPSRPSRDNSETSDSIVSMNSSKSQDAPISNFLPPPKPFRHAETQRNQGARKLPLENKNDALPAPSYDEGTNIEPQSLSQSKPRFQSRSGTAHMETQPIQNFQPPPKPFRRSQPSKDGGACHIDGKEENNGRGRGRIAKYTDGDKCDSNSRNSSENDGESHVGTCPSNFVSGSSLTPPAPSRSEKLGENIITSEGESLKGANVHEKPPSPSGSPIQVLGSNRKAPPPVVKPKPKNFSLKVNESPKKPTNKGTTNSPKRNGEVELLNTITDELSHFKLRKTNVNLEELGSLKNVKGSSPVHSDLDDKYVSASGSITPPRPPPPRTSAKKVPPVVPRKNDSLKKKPPVVPKKKILLRSLEPRPIKMEGVDLWDKSDDDDNLNPFERYKRNVVPQEEDRLHK